MAQSADNYRQIEQLAFEIIPEFYAELIHHDHNLFFVQKFQTVAAIEDQVKNGYEYYLILSDGVCIGYFALQFNQEQAEMILSKLYLLKAFRGNGFGTHAMDFIIQRTNDRQITRSTLTVNRQNIDTIRWYEKYGYVVTRELVNRFENGHTMLDYEMTRKS